MKYKIKYINETSFTFDGELYKSFYGTFISSLEYNLTRYVTIVPPPICFEKNPIKFGGLKPNTVYISPTTGPNKQPFVSNDDVMDCRYFPGDEDASYVFGPNGYIAVTVDNTDGHGIVYPHSGWYFPKNVHSKIEKMSSFSKLFIINIDQSSINREKLRLIFDIIGGKICKLSEKIPIEKIKEGCIYCIGSSLPDHAIEYLCYINRGSKNIFDELESNGVVVDSNDNLTNGQIPTFYFW